MDIINLTNYHLAYSVIPDAIVALSFDMFPVIEIYHSKEWYII